MLLVEAEVAAEAAEAQPVTEAAEPVVEPADDTEPVESAEPKTSDRQLEPVATVSPAVPSSPALDLTPGDLLITREELVFMKRLAPLFQTPRAAKRLANVYRLVRVSVGADRIVTPDAYEHVLVLLSVAIAFPALARDLLLAIASRPGEDWSTLLDRLRPEDSAADRFQNVVSSDLSPSDAAAWARLVEALEMIWPEDDPRPLTGFFEWIEIVADYSFHPWQEQLSAGTRS